ncbi:MAG: glycosyltransferase, partial [Planctomycetota bacterium]
GVEVAFLTRDSSDLGNGLAGKLRAFVGGIHSLSAQRRMSRLLREVRPDIVHVHNLLPLLSPSVLVACRSHGVPVVMTCHNYRLTCPTGLHVVRGEVCERCISDGEHRCVLQDCRNSLFESAAYALRHAVGRWGRTIPRNVTLFIALTEFLKRRLVTAGFPRERIAVIPNMADLPAQPADPVAGQYAAYAGRISPEKGLDTLLAAARRLPGIPIRIAGDWSTMPEVREQAPDNVDFVGFLDRDEVARFYRKARFLVLPSTCFEVFPLVLAEAMGYGLPAVASRIGGLPEIVEDGRTGLLFEAGDADELASKMEMLWEDSALCARMGQAARHRAAREFSEDVFYSRLMDAYQAAVQLNGQERD